MVSSDAPMIHCSNCNVQRGEHPFCTVCGWNREQAHRIAELEKIIEVRDVALGLAGQSIELREQWLADAQAQCDLRGQDLWRAVTQKNELARKNKRLREAAERLGTRLRTALDAKGAEHAD